MNQNVTINEESNQDYLFEVPQLEKIKQVSNQDLFSVPTYTDELPSNIQEISLQSGGDSSVPGLKQSDPSPDQHTVTNLAGESIPVSPNLESSPKDLFNLEQQGQPLSDQSLPEQAGGNDFNPEGFDLSELEEVQLEDGGNPNNPGEDPEPVDQDMYELQDDSQPEPPEWIHPDLSIEDDQEMVSRMNQEEIESRVNSYLENYYSDVYQKYQKYYQNCHSASNQKYSLRRDKKGNLYLVARPPPPKENKGKKVKENVKEVVNDQDFEKHYLIKLTPPQYIKISETLKDITHELNVLSGDIKLLQQELIEQGAEIHDEDVKHFKKIRRKFYKLINKKYIYTKYYQEVNGLNVTEAQTPVYAKEIITDVDKDDNKIYKFKTHMVNASETLLQNMINQIQDDLDNYTHVINHNREDEKEYHGLIKTFLNEKKNNQEKIQKELSTLISLQKDRVDYLIEKLPKLDIKKDPF